MTTSPSTVSNTVSKFFSCAWYQRPARILRRKKHIEQGTRQDYRSANELGARVDTSI